MALTAPGVLPQLSTPYYDLLTLLSSPDTLTGFGSYTTKTCKTGRVISKVTTADRFGLAKWDKPRIAWILRSMAISF